MVEEKNKLMAKKLRSMMGGGMDGGLHIHIHIDQPVKEEPKERKEDNAVDEDGYMKVRGMSPSVS